MALEIAETRFRSNGEDARSSLGRFVSRSQTGRLMLVTAHRRENWGEPLRRLAGTVRDLLESNSDLHVLWPLHINPVVRRAVVEILSGVAPDVAARLQLTEPLPYVHMLWAMKNAWLTLTDSGGIQEEAAALRVPVLVARKTTERPELVEAGGGAMVGTDPRRICRWFEMLARDEKLHARMSTIENPYGEGRSASQIASILERDVCDTIVRPQRLAA
jgi:UDP-N-acetylglucosamine 2-epimerase (non-hydrolysing)/UDP-N-acetylglucosamine 2-epimerase (hydrolysing)